MTERFDWSGALLPLPDGTLQIMENAFDGAILPETLTVPAGVSVIGESAFLGCASLRRIVLPEGLCEIGPGAFSACAALEKINFPDTLRRIGEGAFLYCKSLTEARLPASLEELGELAFLGCDCLSRASLPNPDCAVGAYAFGGFFPEEAPEEWSVWDLPRDSHLREADFAFPFPPEAEDPEKLLYALLWCARPGHREDYVAAGFLRSHTDEAFAYILRCGRPELLSPLLREGFVPPEKLDAYGRAAAETGRREITALLLSAAAEQRSRNGFDFEKEFGL